MRVVHTIEGEFRVWASDQVGAVLSGGAFWDWPIKPAIDAAAERAPQAWAIDCGAAFGWFTVYLARRFARVLAVEAYAPTYMELLVPNLLAHGLSEKVDAVHWVAYDQPAYFALASDAMHGWPLVADLDQQPNASSLAFVPIQPGMTEIVAQGGPIDALVPAGAEVALIKVDVQGCDLRALRGLRQTIRRCRPTICFEYEGGPSLWHGDELVDYLRWFESEGYDCQELPGSNYVAEPR